MHFHWQNLNDRQDSGNGNGFWHGRCWWHFSDRKSIGLEWCFGRKQNQCQIGFGCDDEGWDASISVWKLFALYWNFNIGLPTPQIRHRCTTYEPCVGTAEELKDRKSVQHEFWATDQRSFRLAIHDNAIWLAPWERTMEWRKSDPWWIRGVVLHIDDLLLGRTNYSSKVVDSFDIRIPLPEGSYVGHVKIEERVWKRPRWFALRRRDAVVSVGNGGIPFPGKGENSWDCGMDGLCGYGCSSTKPEDIIARGVQSVLESRRRYGGSVDWMPPIEVGT